MREKVRPIWPKHVPGNAGYALDVRNPINGDTSPVVDGLRFDPQRSGKLDGAARSSERLAQPLISNFL
jgi:hypothetical protein